MESKFMVMMLTLSEASARPQHQHLPGKINVNSRLKRQKLSAESQGSFNKMDHLMLKHACGTHRKVYSREISNENRHTFVVRFLTQ